MTGPRSPGRGPLTWVVLGLLALSWLNLFALFVYGLVSEPTGPPVAYVLAGIAWLFVTGPHLLFGYAVWRGGRDAEVVLTAFVAGLPLAVVSLVLLALLLFVGLRPDAGPSLTCLALLVWFGAWLLSLKTLILAHRQPRASPPDDD